MSDADEVNAEARRRTQALLDSNKVKEPDWITGRDQQRAGATKTARLRELRIVKEAADNNCQTIAGRSFAKAINGADQREGSS